MVFIASIIALGWLGRARRGFSFAPTSHLQFATLAVEHTLVLRISSVPWVIQPRNQVQRDNLVIGQQTPNRSDVGGSTSNGVATVNHAVSVGTLAATYRVYPYASLSGRPAYKLVEIRLYLPYWLMIVVSFGVAAGCFAYLRRHNPAPGVCPHCGYDLRATPERCPECGTPANRTKQPPAQRLAPRHRHPFTSSPVIPPPPFAPA
jgi:hypothetical protein